MTSTRGAIFLSLSLTLAGCASAEGTGDLGFSCFRNGTCNEGLVCVEQVCREPSGSMDAGPSADASHTDAGPERDAASLDASLDASMSDAATPDAAMADAATPDAAVLDGGPMDASTDAGTPAVDLPLDHPVPPSATGISLTRLGQRAFILAYTDDTDTSSAEGEELVLQRVTRVGHRLVFDAPERLTEATIDPGTDNPLHLMGALGDEHFFLIVQRPDASYVLRWFADRGGSFVDLGSEALIAGADFAGLPGFFHGHPVDDTRHLLGYRENNSGQPYRYRLMVRVGDTVSLGPPVTRPAPSAFVGLSPNESQTDPSLFRVGPTTFVEARPGYVSLPGYLATWILEVGASGTLTASDPQVHDTVGQTMTAEVAADGRGGALLAYHSYAATDWYPALYVHGSRTLTQGPILGTSTDSSIRTHQGESTDRFLGGSYYLRLHGGSATAAPLFRVDASDGTVERLADVPDLWWCYRAPQMVRLGTIAAYAGCDEITFVDLRPLCGDGALDPDETCDDGNNDDGDGCTAGCIAEPA